MTVRHDSTHAHPHIDAMTEAVASHPVGTAGGAVGGAVAGAAIGTVGGPVGTAIGAAIGAIAGSFAGNAVAATINAGDKESFSLSEPVLGVGATMEHDRIATCAYYIWEAAGRSDGHALDDWLRAESFLRADA